MACTPTRIVAAIGGRFGPMLQMMMDVSKQQFAAERHSCIAFFVQCVGLLQQPELETYLSCSGTALIRSMHFGRIRSGTTSRSRGPLLTLSAVPSFPAETDAWCEYGFAVQGVAVRLLTHLVELKSLHTETAMLESHLLCCDLALPVVGPWCSC
jgi:hypothetical protein